MAKLNDLLFNQNRGYIILYVLISWAGLSAEEFLHVRLASCHQLCVCIHAYMCKYLQYTDWELQTFMCRLCEVSLVLLLLVQSLFDVGVTVVPLLHPYSGFNYSCHKSY